MNAAKSIVWSAIQSLVRGKGDMEEFVNPAGVGHSRVPRQSALYTEAMGRHEYPEVALPVAGKPCMVMDGKWYPLTAGRFAAITPGVEHVEGCASAKDGYTLLWLIFSKHTMIAFACQHAPRQGWRSFMNFSLDSPRVTLLRNLIQYGGPEFVAGRVESIRTNILAVLTELYDKEIIKSHSAHTGRAREKYAEALESLHDFIDTHYADRLDVDTLARMSGLSTCYLNRLFARKYGISVQEHIIATRMKAAETMLKISQSMIKQIAVKCGYTDPLYFSKAFRKHFGFAPSDLRTS